MPILSKAPGFVAYYVVFDENDRGTSVSLFDSQAPADESTRLAADWVQQNMIGLVVGPPTVTSPEITVHQVG